MSNLNYIHHYCLFSLGIINPSSSSTDGQGTVKAGLLSFGSVEARNLESKLRLEARHVFFTEVKAEL